MIRHIVMWKLKDQALGLDKAGLAKALEAKLKALVGKIPEIKGFEVGLNELAGETQRDVVLVSSFDDLAALQRYQEHPDHQEVVAFVKQVVDERRGADYTVSV